MEALEIIDSISQSGDIYAWFEKQADAHLVKAVQLVPCL